MCAGRGVLRPHSHHHLPIPRTLGLNVISISERWRHAHSLSRPSLPTTLPKETSNIHWKGCLQRSPWKRERKGGKKKKKRRREEEYKKYIILWGEELIGSQMEYLNTSNVLTLALSLYDLFLCTPSLSTLSLSLSLFPILSALSLLSLFLSLFPH